MQEKLKKLGLKEMNGYLVFIDSKYSGIKGRIATKKAHLTIYDLGDGSFHLQSNSYTDLIYSKAFEQIKFKGKSKPLLDITQKEMCEILGLKHSIKEVTATYGNGGEDYIQADAIEDDINYNWSRSELCNVIAHKFNEL